MCAFSPKTIAIIQARMSASRLPGKVLLDIADQPMLAHVVQRTRLAKTVGDVVVATTTDASDDPIAEYCHSHSIEVYRGSQFDVLDRYYQAACLFQAKAIVRITADCPLIDPGLVDHTVQYFFGRIGGPHPDRPGPFPWDFAANRLPPPWGRTYPIGLDTEVCTFSVLEYAWNNAQQPHQREHVMPYLYEFSPIADSRHLEEYTPPDQLSSPDPDQPRFRALLVNHRKDYGSLRWTVDTPEDLQLVRYIFDHFHGQEVFSWQDVLTYYLANPELAQINSDVQHKKLYDIDTRNSNP